MEKNYSDFQNFNIQDAQALAQSDAAKQLYRLLHANQSRQLNAAIEQAASGNMEQAALLVRQMMDSPDARALLQQLKGDANG